MLSGKKILIGITGSIAAYKAILLVRLLVKQGAEVKVLMTPAAKDFVSPLVLATLSKNEVLTDIADGSAWANHVMLGRWADLMLVAPASCNTLAKMAHGQCDNLLQAVYLSATCPVMLAPAMDEDMWKHPSTRHNLQILRSYGNCVLQVGNGELASGLVGEGRMAEPEEIVERIAAFFHKSRALSGLKALVTAGPTYEPIDPVRFIGNHSSGKMGVAIAGALAAAGADTVLVLGPSSVTIPQGVKVVRVQTAEQMYNACMKQFDNTDITVMAAAVADYRPMQVANEKIKKSDEALQIELVKNPDILKACGAIKRSNQLLVGFALETTNEQQHALQKLKAKNADMIVLNSLRDEKAGFGTDTNKVTIFEKSGQSHDWALQTKESLAAELVELLAERWKGING